MRKYSKRFKTGCLKLFLEGKTLKEIAKIKNVPFTTLITWHGRSKWAAKSNENDRKTTENLQILVSEEKAQELFDSRHELIEEATVLKTLFENTLIDLSEPLKPMEAVMFKNVLINASRARQNAIFSIAKIDGLIIDKAKLDVNVDVARQITKILTYRRQGLREDDSHLRLLPRQKA